MIFFARVNFRVRCHVHFLRKQFSAIRASEWFFPGMGTHVSLHIAFINADVKALFTLVLGIA